MGAWGPGYKANDDYGILLSFAMKPIEKELNRKANAYNELVIVAAAGLLYDIEKATDIPFFDIHALAIEKLEQIVKQVDFSSWRNPSDRKKHVHNLLIELKVLEKATKEKDKLLIKRYYKRSKYAKRSDMQNRARCTIRSR